MTIHSHQWDGDYTVTLDLSTGDMEVSQDRPLYERRPYRFGTFTVTGTVTAVWNLAT